MADQPAETRITLRLPTELRDKLEVEAAKRSRSMNGEIVDRLEQSLSLPDLEALDLKLKVAEVRGDTHLEVVRLLSAILAGITPNADQALTVVGEAVRGLHTKGRRPTREEADELHVSARDATIEKLARLLGKPSIKGTVKE